MSGFSEKLTRKQEAAILALLSTRTVEEAARVADVKPERSTDGKRSLSSILPTARRNGCPSVSQSLDSTIYQVPLFLLLGKVMLDTATPPATKVRAADSILNHSIKAMETEEIVARVAELERALEARKKSGR